MTDVKELEIYNWTVKNWKRLSKKAESFNKNFNPTPISVQLEKRFLIDSRTAAKIANDVALWLKVNRSYTNEIK